MKSKNSSVMSKKNIIARAILIFFSIVVGITDYLASIQEVISSAVGLVNGEMDFWILKML